MSYKANNESISDLHMNLPGLISFWPIGPTNLSGDVVDMAGNSNLTNVKPAPYRFDEVTYLDFDGSPTSYLAHTADGTYDIVGNETYIDTILQGLTIGGWFWIENIAAPAYLISKWDLTIAQKSYLLNATPSNNFEFSISGDGTAIEAVTSTSSVLNGVWVFVAGRYSLNLGTVSVFLNTEITTLPAVAASIFQSTSDLVIGTASPIIGGHLDGRVKNLFISSAAIPDSEMIKLYNNSKALMGI